MYVRWSGYCWLGVRPSYPLFLTKKSLNNHNYSCVNPEKHLTLHPIWHPQLAVGPLLLSYYRNDILAINNQINNKHFSINEEINFIFRVPPVDGGSHANVGASNRNI